MPTKHFSLFLLFGFFHNHQVFPHDCLVRVAIRIIIFDPFFRPFFGPKAGSKKSMAGRIFVHDFVGWHVLPHLETGQGVPERQTHFVFLQMIDGPDDVLGKIEIVFFSEFQQLLVVSLSPLDIGVNHDVGFDHFDPAIFHFSSSVLIHPM
jgi:hypothetical protein